MFVYLLVFFFAFFMQSLNALGIHECYILWFKTENNSMWYCDGLTAQ